MVYKDGGKWQKSRRKCRNNGYPYNLDFNCTEFDAIKDATGSNNFVLFVKTWIERTNAIGIVFGSIAPHGRENFCEIALFPQQKREFVV